MAVLTPCDNQWFGVSSERKVFTTVWAILECLLSGIIYGWPSLVIIFKEEGIFLDMCDDFTTHKDNVTSQENANQTSHTCAEQDEMFSLIFMLCSILMTAGCAVFGHILYLWGSRVTRLCAVILYLVGTISMVFLNRERSWLLFIAAPGIAIAGPAILIVNIQVANLFCIGASMLVGVFTGMYDASAIVQLLVKLCYQQGVSLQESYVCISCLLILFIVSSFLVFPKTYIPKITDMEIDVPEKKEYDLHDVSIVKTAEYENTANEGTAMTVAPYISQTAPTLKECVKSKLFLFHVFWLSVLQLRFYFYVGSMNSFIEFLTDFDKDAVDYYTNLSLYIQSGGLIAAPLIGCFLDHQRRKYRKRTTHTGRLLRPTLLPLTVTCLIGTLMSVVILIPSTNVLTPMFIVFTIYRAFLYGLVAAFIQMIFPARYFGTLWGLTMVLGGVISAFQYPLFIWMDVSPVGPLKVNILLLIVSLTSFAHPVYIWKKCRNDKRKQKQISLIQMKELSLLL